jgi:hypothetical protein
MERGYSILTDDMCVIDRDLNVLPGFPNIKLRDSSCEKLGLTPSELTKVHKNHEKRFLPLGKQFYAKKVPLKLLYVLNTHDEEVIEFYEEKNSINKVEILRRQSFRPRYLNALKNETSHFKRLTNIAPNIDIMYIFYPKSGFDINKLMSLIQEDLMSRDISTGIIRPFNKKMILEDV